MRVSTAVHPLVVVQDREQLSLEMTAPLEDPQADLRMGLHHRPLQRAQRAVLLQDRIRDAELADIMQKARAGENAHLRGGHPELAPDVHAELRDASVVALRLAILDLDRCDQGRDGLDVELLCRHRHLQLQRSLDDGPEGLAASPLDHESPDGQCDRRQHQ